jgi:hypothetical protein
MHDRASSLLIRLLLVAVLSMIAGAACADCNGKLIYVDDLTSVGTNYPLVMKTRRNLYVMRGNCFYLSGGEFRGTITFFTFSRAPEGFSGQVAALVVKSIRTFAVPTQAKKIKLWRNEGWYLPDKADAMSVQRQVDATVGLSLDQWNSLYTNPKPPELFAGLGVPWHAYATEDKMINSTDWADFWKITDANNAEKRITTNYLIRFDVNPDPDSRNRVPFYVDTPNSLQQLDLAVDSNIGSLASTFTFIFR